jgi:hypothetical protein
MVFGLAEIEDRERPTTDAYQIFFALLDALKKGGDSCSN